MYRKNKSTQKIVCFNHDRIKFVEITKYVLIKIHKVR